MIAKCKSRSKKKRREPSTQLTRKHSCSTKPSSAHSTPPRSQLSNSQLSTRKSPSPSHSSSTLNSPTFSSIMRRLGLLALLALLALESVALASAQSSDDKSASSSAERLADAIARRIGRWAGDDDDKCPKGVTTVQVRHADLHTTQRVGQQQRPAEQCAASLGVTLLTRTVILFAAIGLQLTMIMMRASSASSIHARASARRHARSDAWRTIAAVAMRAAPVALTPIARAWVAASARGRAGHGATPSRANWARAANWP